MAKRWVDRGTLRGTGTVQSGGEEVATVRYWLTVQQAEQAFNDQWLSVWFFQPIGRIDVLSEISPFLGLMNVVDPVLVMEDGRRLPIIVPTNGSSFNLMPTGEVDLPGLVGYVRPEE